jgi:hypothetical protein
VVQATDPSALLSPGLAGRFQRRSGHEPGPGGDVTPTPDGVAAPPAAPPVTVIGTGWDSVAIVSGQSLPQGVRGFLDGATPVTLANGATGRLITTRLVNVLVLDDGRLAVGAVTPEALEHAVAGR